MSGRPPETSPTSMSVTRPDIHISGQYHEVNPGQYTLDDEDIEVDVDNRYCWMHSDAADLQTFQYRNILKQQRN